MDSMTLEQASYIGELIAVIAVIASLIYMALQKEISRSLSSNSSTISSINTKDRPGCEA